MIDLGESLEHSIWKGHERNKSQYQMDGLEDHWALVYYPIFQDGKTQEYYSEPRALMQNTNKPGFWSKEVPLRYLNKL
jgi:hypothetical protein|tara:strand:+ start:619 stop:852 length:234 start_codon:yes stop_codon:yes gene_type:complete